MDNVGLTNTLRSCNTAVPRQWLVFNSSTSAPKRLTSYTVSSITRTATVATLTTASAHHLRVGDIVAISGANQAGYNGDVVVVTVPSTTTFTYTPPADGNVAAATGTLVAYAKVPFRQATFYGRKTDHRTDSTDLCWLGASSVNGEQNVPVGAGGEIVWPVATGAKIFLSDIYLDPVVADEGVSISFH